MFDEMKKYDPIGAVIAEEMMMHSIELDIAGKTDPKQRKDILNDVVEHVLKVANDVLTEREKLEMGQPMLERQDRFIVYFTPGIMKLFTDPTRRALFEAKLIGLFALFLNYPAGPYSFFNFV